MNWFNSSYYHILYKNRDYNEAEYFINNLITKLNIKKNSKILDLACGSGRHSIYLNKKEKQINSDIIEIHNRPNYIKYLDYNHHMWKLF